MCNQLIGNAAALPEVDVLLLFGSAARLYSFWLLPTLKQLKRTSSGLCIVQAHLFIAVTEACGRFSL